MGPPACTLPIFSSRSSSSSNTMSLLDCIDRDLVYRNPKIAAAILEFEGIHVISLCYFHLQMNKKGRNARRTWVRGYLKCRATKSHYVNLMLELAAENAVLYHNFTLMSEAMFNEIVDRVQPYIERQTMFWRKPFGPALRVAITLRFLATRNSYKNLGYAFRVAPNTISLFVPKTCKAFADEYLQRESLYRPCRPPFRCRCEPTLALIATLMKLLVLYLVDAITASPGSLPGYTLQRHGLYTKFLKTTRRGSVWRSQDRWVRWQDRWPGQWSLSQTGWPQPSSSPSS